MNSVISTYISADYIFFTFAGIRTELNKEGVEKKKPIGMPNWREVNKNNYEQYINSDHHGLAIICGEMSGITIFDFDNANEYDKLIEIYPELKQHKTIKTNKGYHIYCKYNASVLTTTNAFVNISGVDIRNDASIIFAPPTKYKLLDGSTVHYEDLGGEIQIIPEFLLNKLKQNNKNIAVKDIKTKRFTDVDGKSDDGSDTSEESNGDDDAEIDIEMLKKLYRCFNEQRITDHITWVNLAQATSNYAGEQGKVLFMEITNKYGSSNKMKECSKKYDYCNVKKTTIGKTVSIGSLKYWAKMDNKELYGQLFPKSANAIIIVKNDKEAADVIYSQIKDKIKLSNGSLFYKHSNIWTSNDKYTHTAIRTYVLSSKIMKMGTLGVISFAQNFSDADHITKIVIGMAMTTPDNSFYNKFVTSTKGKLCFENGVLDFATKRFTEWKDIPNTEEIVSSVCINRNFNATRDEKNIKDVKDKIFDAIFDIDANKALAYLSRGVAGHIEDKAWGLFTGNRDCGKGVIETLNKNSLECYVANINSAVFLCERITEGGDQAKKLSWTLELEFARLAFTQECKFDKNNKNIKIDGTIIKKIASGGDNMQARKNYQDERNFIIQSRLILSGNDFPRIEPTDTMEKCVQFNTTKQFKSKEFIKQRKDDGATELELQKYRVADDKIKEKCLNVEWKDAYIHLLLDYYEDIPVEIDVELNANDDTSNALINDIDKYFEITKNDCDKISNKDLNEWIDEFGINASVKKIKNELKGAGCKDYRSEKERGIKGLRRKYLEEKKHLT